MPKRDPHPNVTNESFAELVKASNLTFVNDTFQLENDSGWITKGDRVRGEFVLIDMGRNYQESELEATLALESQRLGGTLRLATTYELVCYAINGWDGSSLVAAFGSSYFDSSGKRLVAMLDSLLPNQRELFITWAGGLWGEIIFVLCITE